MLGIGYDVCDCVCDCVRDCVIVGEFCLKPSSLISTFFLHIPFPGLESVLPLWPDCSAALAPSECECGCIGFCKKCTFVFAHIVLRPPNNHFSAPLLFALYHTCKTLPHTQSHPNTHTHTHKHTTHIHTPLYTPFHFTCTHPTHRSPAITCGPCPCPQVSTATRRTTVP